MRRILQKVLKKYQPGAWKRKFVFFPVHLDYWSKTHECDITESVWLEWLEARYIPEYIDNKYQRYGGYYEYRNVEEK